MSDTTDIQVRLEASETDLAPEVTFVRSTMGDLRRSSLRLRHDLKDRWFPTAFNDWYCPAIRRGYVGGIAPIFDIGVTLMEPHAEVMNERGYGALLQWIKEHPVLGELARLAVSRRGSGPGTDEMRGLITWMVIEPLLRCLSGVWNSVDADRRGRELPSGELPIIERRAGKIHIRAGANEKAQLYKVDVRSFESTSGVDNAADSAALSDDTRERAIDCVLPTVEAVGVRLFGAHVARLVPELAHKLDHEVVDACLLGPLLRTRDHEPPRRSPTDSSNSRESRRPGPIGGFTRVVIRRPGDPFTSILPSEWLRLRESREAGLAYILNGPQVVRQEDEEDVAPKHRALVCYILDAHQNMLSRRRGVSSGRAGGSAYRDGYVYAKRQVFDTLHDLADAQALVRLTADVQIDAAVFAIPPGREHAVVHRRILLDGLTRGATGDDRIDRLTEMITMAELIPRYFIRHVEERGRSPDIGVGTADILPPDVAGYLRDTAQRGKFRIIHLVLVALDNATRLMERLHRYLQYRSSTPIYVTLIGVNRDENDSDIRLIGLREPAWTYAETGSLREAIALDAGGLEPIPLAELRARFVESIFGKEVEPTTAQLSRIRVD